MITVRTQPPISGDSPSLTEHSAACIAAKLVDFKGKTIKICGVSYDAIFHCNRGSRTAQQNDVERVRVRQLSASAWF